MLQIGLILLSLSILIAIHEFGHFIAARMFGIRVDKFYLFFDAWGFKLFSIKRGGTEYGIGWLPLGGYVKIAGMLDESMDKEQMDAPAQPDEFRSKPVWQRLIVMLGGIIMNIILGILLYTSIYWLNGTNHTLVSKMEDGIAVTKGSVGEVLGLKSGDKLVSYNGKPLEYLETVTDPNIFLYSGSITVDRGGQNVEVPIPDCFINQFADLPDSKKSIMGIRIPPILAVSDSSAEGYKKGDSQFRAFDAGLRTGDRILSMDGEPVNFYDEMSYRLDGKANTTVKVAVLRNQDTVYVNALTDSSALLGVGIQAYDDSHMRIHNSYGFGGAFGVGTSKAWSSASNTLRGLYLLVTGCANPMKSMAGPIKISKVMEQGYSGGGGWLFFWMMTAYLSMVLAVMNLLPIPILDGGHVLFLMIEGITGREIPPKWQERLLTVGFVIIAALMAFIILNDILNYSK